MIIETTLGRVHGGPDTVFPVLSGLVGLDVESSGLEQFAPGFRMRTVQLATEDEAWVFDLSIPEHVVKARRYLEDESLLFCSHTPMDVLSVSAALGIDISARNLDTRTLASMVYQNTGDKRDLKTLTRLHLGPGLGAAEKDLTALFREMYPGKKGAAEKEVKGFGFEHADTASEVFVRYAGMDAIACRRLVPILVELADNPPELLAKECWLAVRAVQLESRGVLLDIEQTTRINVEASQVYGDASERALGITGGVKVNSNKFIVPWLESQGVDWSSWEYTSKVTGGPSIQRKHVAALRRYPLTSAGAALVGVMEEFKGSADIRTKTQEMLRLVDTRGRLHPTLQTIGAAATARMSSSGPNLQNFSKENPLLRGCFIPEPGHTLVSIDFDQVELRVVAGLAREKKMIDTIKSGGDLHQLTVDELAAAGIQINRAVGKMTNFLIVYGGGGQALHEQASIPLEEAKQIVRKWRERYPAIQRLTQDLMQHTDFLRTISGRKLAVKSFKGETKAYANINYLVQSSARDLLVDAWYRLEESFGRRGIVWFPIHDELCLQVPNGQLEEVTADAERAMSMDFMGVPITAGAAILRDEHGVSRWGK